MHISDCLAHEDQKWNIVVYKTTLSPLSQTIQSQPQALWVITYSLWVATLLGFYPFAKNTIGIFLPQLAFRSERFILNCYDLWVSHLTATILNIAAKFTQVESLSIITIEVSYVR